MKMTLNDIANAINERNAAENEAVDNNLTSNHSADSWLDRYGLGVDQAERIAERANTLDEFEDIWENETWWIE